MKTLSRYEYHLIYSSNGFVCIYLTESTAAAFQTHQISESQTAAEIVDKYWKWETVA